MIEKQPMHGYQILSSIRKTYGVSFGVSSLYPLLNSMEEQKFLRSSWGMNGNRPKRVYELTSKGKNLLESTVDSLARICCKIEINGKNNASSSKNFRPDENELYLK